MKLTAPCHWPSLIQHWIDGVLCLGLRECGYAIHSNGRIEVGPMMMNG